MSEYSEDEYGYGVYGDSTSPIVLSHLIDLFPIELKRANKDGSSSVFARTINSHEAVLRREDSGLDYIRQSRQIDEAAGSDLNNIGSKFGQLGKRRGRSDSEYRTYLKGLVQSFNGRGTVPGLKFAIAAAVNTDTENIVIDEDFTNNEYEVRIEDTSAGFISGVVNEISELADPSGVELASAPIVTLEGDEVRVSATESTVTGSEIGLNGGVLTMDGASTLN